MSVDLLAIGAHPDDVELIIGGTVAKLTRKGKRVALIDLTRGEMGTRGTPDIRAREAAEAARVLGITERINLDMGDGRLENTFENRVRLIEEIRRLRPVIVMCHHWEDLHPDHVVAAELIRSIMYPVGMEKFPAKGTPYRPHEFLFFMGHFPFQPQLIVDISDDFQTKLAAARCYASQLYQPDATERPTNISQPDFLLNIEARARHYGSQILKTYGEPFGVLRPVPVDDPTELYRPFRKI